MFEGFWPTPKAQSRGPIRRPRRASSLFARRKWNKSTIPPPESKRERIEAGRRKLVEKARRSAERSAAAKAANKAKAKSETGEARA